MVTKTREKEGDEKRTRKKPAKAGANKEGKKPKRSTARAPRTKKAATQNNARELALSVARVGLDKRALNVEIIDVQGKVDYADYVVVLSGRSDRQVAALAGHIQEELNKARGTRCLSIEGLPHGRWVLMDYSDVVVHIFHEDVRGYYDLESLWIDAARVSVD